MRCFIVLICLTALAVIDVNGFQPISKISTNLEQKLWMSNDQCLVKHNQQTRLFAINNNDQSENKKNGIFKNVISNIKRVPQLFKNNSIKRPINLAISIALLTSFTTLIKPSSVDASAPVMALPKAEGRDPASEAIMEYERRNVAKTQQSLNDMTKEARKIEAEQGEAARIKFENGFKDRQQKEADERAAGLIELKRTLLEQGICPFTDIEGQRQTLFYTRGVDLGKVPGTQFYLEKEFERTAPKRSMAYKKIINRKVIACMVEDMKNRDIDPVNYFEKHQDQTEAILDLPVQKAAALVRQYEANLEEYGQIVPPKEGEVSVKQKLSIIPADPSIAKEKLKDIKDAENAKMKQLKEQAKIDKARIAAETKAAKQATKDAEKKAKLAAKEDSSAAKTAAAAAIAAAAATSAALSQSSSIASDSLVSLQDSVSSIVEQIDATEAVDDFTTNSQPTTSNTATPENKISSSVAAGAAVVVVGGGGIAFKIYKDQADKKEEERQRQLRLLMGTISPSSAPALEEVDTDMDDIDSVKIEKKKAAPVVKATPVPETNVAVPAPKKRSLGLKNVFGKKKSERETDLMVLVSDDADAPEFTTTLSKMLSFGAPGRFPSVVRLPGGMPMTKFELNEAKQILIDAQTEAGLSLEESAEVFANVVNCMLIDIVDLASSSLKEKDEKVTVDAINVVVDFMNHAASLYDSIADGITINPVTYGGDLSKSKLEQMYSSYAVSGMMNMDKVTEDFDSRVAMLQDVFQINEKKAEGLMMKAMQKNMMKMMKDGEGMEGMEEMLKGMGGLDGMPPGLGEMDGDGPSPEQLKEMLTALKTMKDSGSIPPDEFDKVKKQFNEAFGSSIDDVVKEASGSNDELSSTDKELLELMKAIMKD